MKANSPLVTSNQTGPHKNIQLLVERHLQSHFQQPIAQHNQSAYESLLDRVGNRKLIIDSGCGTGKSTLILAKAHPEAFVVGVDKSFHRIQIANTKAVEDTESSSQSNYHFVRSDLTDFYRLAAKTGIKLYKHYILYPNPWPKKQHLQRRWHGSPVFKDILALGGYLELRSNWPIYIKEFALALDVVKLPSSISELSVNENSISDFEEKYHASNHRLWQLNSNLDIDRNEVDDDNLPSLAPSTQL